MFHRTFLAALLVAGAALAEERFGVKGQFVPSGSISYTHASVGGTSAYQFTLAPGLLWFPINAVALGGSVSYQHVSGLFGGSTNSFAIGPLLGVALPLADRVALFPRVGIDFSWLWPAVGASGNAITLVAVAPVLFFPAPHFFLGFGPNFQVDIHRTGATQTLLGLSSEIGGYF
jgi:hypothetical protein